MRRTDSGQSRSWVSKSSADLITCMAAVAVLFCSVVLTIAVVAQVVWGRHSIRDKVLLIIVTAVYAALLQSWSGLLRGASELRRVSSKSVSRSS